MTVRELIDELKAFNPNDEVYIETANGFSEVDCDGEFEGEFCRGETLNGRSLSTLSEPLDEFIYLPRGIILSIGKECDLDWQEDKYHRDYCNCE